MLLSLLAGLAPGCRGAIPAADPSHEGDARGPDGMLAGNAGARELLCADVGPVPCLAACADDLAPREHAECLIELRFGTDPAAAELARALYARTNTLLGIDVRASIDGYRGQVVDLFPALPLGEQRHHLEWLHTSMASIEAFVGSLAPHAKTPVSFEPHPRAVVFFQTAVTSYPSAYSWEGLIGYNLRGPLHTNPRDVHETFFHELFHLNDAARTPRGANNWSVSALGPLFESIVTRCGQAHECFAPFAPHATVVPDGTYYAFDERTRDVREYAAELALRYFLEHEAILAGTSRQEPAFKCLTDENGAAWRILSDEFFGGADLTEC